MLTSLDRLVAAVLLALLVVGAALIGRPSEVRDGAPRVVDGDTIEVGGSRIRLAGFDAPELDQSCDKDGGTYRCGEVARTALIALIGTSPVSCRISGHDKYGRALARCEADGIDLGRTMVRRGLAVSYGDYTSEEAEARRLRLGLWAGHFDQPSAWRATHRHHLRQAAERVEAAPNAAGREP